MVYVGRLRSVFFIILYFLSCLQLTDIFIISKKGILANKIKYKMEFEEELSSCGRASTFFAY